MTYQPIQDPLDAHTVQAAMSAYLQLPEHEGYDALIDRFCRHSPVPRAVIRERLVRNRSLYVIMVRDALDHRAEWRQRQGDGSIFAFSGGEYPKLSGDTHIRFDKDERGRWRMDVLPDTMSHRIAARRERQRLRQQATTSTALHARIRSLGGVPAEPPPGDSSRVPEGIRTICRAQWPHAEETSFWSVLNHGGEYEWDPDMDDIRVCSVRFIREPRPLDPQEVGGVEGIEGRSFVIWAVAHGGHAFLLADAADPCPLDPIIYMIDHYSPEQALQEIGPLSLLLQEIEARPEGNAERSADR